MTSRYANRQRLQYLLFMLRHHQVGGAVEIAAKPHCSIRTVKYGLAKLRKDGFNIQYDKTIDRYVLEEE